MRRSRRRGRPRAAAAATAALEASARCSPWRLRALVVCGAALAALGGLGALFSYYYDVHVARRSAHWATVRDASAALDEATSLATSFPSSSSSSFSPLPAYSVSEPRLASEMSAANAAAASTPPLRTPPDASALAAISAISAFGAGRAVTDLRLTPARCGFMHAPKPPQSDKKCSTSATCSLGRFCHPERKVCGDFCQPLPPRHRAPPQKLVPRPKDVWLVSYPKSGSTWLRHLIWNLHRFNTQRKAAAAEDTASFAKADRPSTFAEVDKGIPFLEDRATGPIRKIFQDKEGLRIFKSHQAYSCDVSPCRGWVASRQARWQCDCPNCASRFRRVIYVVRDGRPVMASYWKFQGELHLKGYRKNFGDFLSLKQRRYPGVSWSDHVRSWMSAPTGQNLDILWVRYEDMRSDTAAVLRRVGRWLQMAHDEAAVAWAVQASSAESMSVTENESGPGLFAKKYKKRDSHFRMVHLTSKDGKSPAHKIPWRSHFVQLTTTPANENPGKNKAVFDAEHRYMLECLGYPLDLVSS
jgi:hypothetical protein